MDMMKRCSVPNMSWCSNSGRSNTTFRLGIRAISLRSAFNTLHRQHLVKRRGFCAGEDSIAVKLIAAVPKKIEGLRYRGSIGRRRSGEVSVYVPVGR
jgi:hypothetical protein